MNEREIIAFARSRVECEARAVAAVADGIAESFVAVVRLLTALQGKVFVTGSGTSGHISRRMAHLLSVCGTPASYLQPMDGLHGAMGVVTAGDVVLAISKGGVSQEILDLVQRLQARGAQVVAITGDGSSPLAHAADLSVVVDTVAHSDPGEMIAMGSTLAVGVWGDALAYVLMVERGYSWEQFLHSHPAGAVGKRAQDQEGAR